MVETGNDFQQTKKKIKFTSYTLPSYPQGPHIKVIAAVASRWQRVGDLIGSRCEPHTSRPKSKELK